MPGAFPRILALVRAVLALALALAAAAPVVAQTPDFSGIWRLDPARSDDGPAKVEAVVGGARTVGGDEEEIERVKLRQWMIPTVENLGRFEVVQRPTEIKLVGGEDESLVRIFRFDGERTRIGELGIKLKYKTRWEGATLVIEEDGKHKLVDTLAYDADGKSLVHTLRFESKLLKAPLDLRLVYTRAN